MSLDQLNEMFRASEIASEGGAGYHHLGEFNATVAGVKAKKIKVKSGEEKPVYELEIRTAIGSVTHTIWGVTAEDVQRAASDPKFREVFQGGMGRIKRLYVDLNVWTEDQLKLSVWALPPNVTASPSNPSVLSDMQQLVGKQCTVNVGQSNKEPKNQVIFVNRPKDNFVDVDLGPMVIPKEPGAQYGATTGAMGPPQLQPPPEQFGGQLSGNPPDLSEIPF